MTRPVFPFAVTLQAVALIHEGDGRPALYLVALDHAGHLRLYRVPDACRVEVTPAPIDLPDVADRPRQFLPAGSAAVFQHGPARSALALHAVRLCRELLEAVEAHGHALTAWQEARQVFDGEEKARTA